MQFGCQSEVGQIQRILLGHPKDTFVSQDKIDRQWKTLNYIDRVDLARALDEYAAFEELIQRHVPEVHYLTGDDTATLDSIYVRDSSLVTKQGAILCNMGKAERRAEPKLVGKQYQSLGIPVHGAITGAGRLEGGDMIWLDEKTLVVGRGYRTNDEGIRQLKGLVVGVTDEVIVVPLPHWDGPDDVLHLMSFISPVDVDLAVVYSRMMPVMFRELLLERGVKLIEVPEEEFGSMACNILTVAPRKCIMIAGNPKTRRLLENTGVEVMEYRGEEISKKGFGGPTCLTRPIQREVEA